MLRIVQYLVIIVNIFLKEGIFIILYNLNYFLEIFLLLYEHFNTGHKPPGGAPARAFISPLIEYMQIKKPVC